MTIAVGAMATACRTVAAIAVLTSAVACGASDGTRRTQPDSTTAALPDSQRVHLVGVGATLPYPLYARWFNTYGEVAPVRINYRSEGSAQGLAAVVAGQSDFGATDVPVEDSLLQRSTAAIMHVPMAVVAVAVTYNVPGLNRPLKLTADVIANIFLGRISRWNDPLLVSLNPKETLPDLPITVIRRSDGTGTSYIFQRYLETASAAWRNTPVANRQAAGQRLRDGSEAVASELKATEGAIGYMEVVYARQNRLPAAHLQNRAGRFVAAMPFEIASAAVNALELLAPLDDEEASGFRVSLLDAPGPQTYPLASFTWWLVRPSTLSESSRGELSRFLHWALEDATDLTAELGYVPLPSSVATRVLDRTDNALGCAPCAPRPMSGTVR
ncbi:phosphate ABC transporter substrate-binding protein PstS [Gemmatimonas sp.]|jgi:phosphate transport system substrate-binding protein|uniref:phosphate ABC transporter substrate-binding protein PstS n=1 Tax=Gemmatimonas sp. TaxID=1962908 RepID=UPI0037BFCD81